MVREDDINGLLPTFRPAVTYSYKLKYRPDDLDLLLPTFKVCTSRIVAGMQSSGYEIVVFDTLRTPKEALRNARRGTGIVNSPHLFGIACDCICNLHGWDCKARGCDFFKKLREAVELEGCISGAGFSSRADWPHFQAVPPGSWQKRISNLGTHVGSAGDRDRLIQAFRKTLRDGK